MVQGAVMVQGSWIDCNRAARADTATTATEDRGALEECNDLYYSLDIDKEVESENDSNKDFDLPLQTTEALSGRAPGVVPILVT
jgi:hypothetical protein